MRVCSPSTVVGGRAGTMPSSDGRAIAESAVEMEDERDRASPASKATVILDRVLKNESLQLLARFSTGEEAETDRKMSCRDVVTSCLIRSPGYSTGMTEVNCVPPVLETSLLGAMDGHGQSSSGVGCSSRSIVFDSTGRNAPRSPRVESDPILCQPLPPASKLTEEGIDQSELELHRQQLARIRERELAEALQDQQWEIERQAFEAESGGHASRKGKGKDAGGVGGKGVETKAFVRPPQAYELYQAIDKKDIDFIMRIRDHAFPLLLQKNAGEFPILYAARIGESHRDVVILLVGAMSRRVNVSI